MKALVAGLIVVGLLVTAGIAGVASAVSFTLNYSDPASDVVKLWTVNMTPVLTSTGNLTMSPFPDSVNLLSVRSLNVSTGVNLTFETKGSIANLDNTSYEMRLYTRADNASHFIVTYVNGTTVLTSNATGFVPVDISGNSTITAAGPNPALLNALRITVARSLLGTITNWNIDATATQRGTPYTYRDFGWELPGNPGSTPAPNPAPSVLPSWIWLAIIPVVIAIVAIVTVMSRRKSKAPPAQ